MPPRYDAAYIARFFDEYGEKEWSRHDAGPAARASFSLHLRYLCQFIQPGERVLETGAGPGRFTIELVRLGARVTVGDLSPGQLRLHQKKVEEAGCEAGVESRQVLDICDLSRFGEGAFDAVVAYGGPLGYVMDRAEDALGEMLRVTRPGGYVLLSVGSLVGSVRTNLPEILDVVERLGWEANDRIVKTGELPRHASGGHECRLYRWQELKELLTRPDCVLVLASASNFITLQNKEALQDLREEAWQKLLAWEEVLCREPGALDGGTHIIAVIQRQE